MKHNRFFLLLATAALMAVFQASAFADLTAKEVKAEFDGLNGRGFLFTTYTDSGSFNQALRAGEISLIAARGKEMPDLGGYVADTSGADYFQTFCVAPLQEFRAGETNIGKLDVTDDWTTTLADDWITTITNRVSTPLNLGIAYLYKEFAAGTLDGYNYTSGRATSAVELQYAIWYLLEETSSIPSDYVKADNIFLNLLSSINPGSNLTWDDTYYLDETYAFMGSAKVFVIRAELDTLARSGANTRQDTLYVWDPGSSDVPEPASILLWTLGSLGAAGMAYRKRRNSVK
jgi:hypothetical protein